MADTDLKCARCGWTQGKLTMVAVRSSRPARLLCHTCEEQVAVAMGDEPIVCAVAYLTNVVRAELQASRPEPMMPHVRPE